MNIYGNFADLGSLSLALTKLYVNKTLLYHLLCSPLKYGIYSSFIYVYSRVCCDVFLVFILTQCLYRYNKLLFKYVLC